MNTTLAAYTRLLLKHWRWLVLGVLVALAATTVFLTLQPPLYRTHATVFVRTPGDVSRVQDGGDSYAQGRAGTYAALVRSTSLSSRVIADLGLDLKPETLSKRIRGSHRPGTALIDITLSAPSAADAQRQAAVLLSEFAATVRSMESVPGSVVPRAEIVVVDPQDHRSASWRGVRRSTSFCSAPRWLDWSSGRWRLWFDPSSKAQLGISVRPPRRSPNQPRKRS